MARMIGKYEVYEGIGYGRSRPRTQVKRGLDTETGREVALKLVDRSQMSEKNLRDLESEVENQLKLAHPNIVSLLDVIWEAEYWKKDGSSCRSVVCLVLELATGGELFDYIFYTQRGFPEDVARTYFQQLIGALVHIHETGYAHRDLKPENLVLDADFNIKVTDMGMSALVRDEEGAPAMLKTQCGTFGYMAPEVLAGLRYKGEPVDVWASGVILFLMLAGFPPFVISKKPGEAVATALANDWWFQRIIHKQHRYFWQAHMRKATFSEDAMALMNKIFRVDPSKRATLADILEDPWFNAGSSVEPDALAADLQRRKDFVDHEKAVERERNRAEREAARVAQAAEGASGGAGEMFTPFDAELTRAPSVSSEEESVRGGEAKTTRAREKIIAPIEPERHCARHSQFRVNATARAVMDRLAQTLSRMCATSTTDHATLKMVCTAGTPAGDVTFQVRVYRARGDAAEDELSTAHVIEVRRLRSSILDFYNVFESLREGMDDIITAPSASSGAIDGASKEAATKLAASEVAEGKESA